MRHIEHIILGVDPGTHITGYGILQSKQGKLEVLAHGAISLGKTADTHPIKLSRIYGRIESLIAHYLPDEMAIEAPFQGKNVQSMLKLGRAQGVAMAAAMQRDIPVAEYSPRKIKKAITGNGNAAKNQVAAMLEQLLPGIQLQEFEYEDASDALAAALCHYFQLTSPFQNGPGGYKDWENFIKNNPNRIR
jgi:crossover junction endodeoxyribonuclease RuvC